MAQPQPQQSSQQARKDPRPRPNDGGIGAIRLKNTRADRHYVWVSLEGDAVSEYEYLGYEVERGLEGGVGPMIGKARLGENITSRGNVLMSAPIERKREIDTEGWALTEQFERRMVNKQQVIKDTMRGLHARPQHVSMESDIGGLEPVR